MQRRKCLNNPNNFCYICGHFMVSKQKMNITPKIKLLYSDYFGITLGDQDKAWAPHAVCRICVSNLRNWSTGNKKSLSFGVPMVWREPQNHVDDCYFCIFKVRGFNAKNKNQLVYPDLQSARRPVEHGPDVPVPVLPCNIELMNCDITSDEKSDDLSWSNNPKLFTQNALNDLVRDLDLPKNASELLASRLHERKMLAPGTLITVYRNREKDFEQFFKKDGNLLYCVDIPNLITKIGAEYKANEWRLFIDSNKRSLKGVLLHNGNVLASVPVAHSVHLKETYHNMYMLLEKVKYKEHHWMICGDLKVLCMLLGQQQGYTKYPCYICQWDSRDRKNHWGRREWPKRKHLTPGFMNIAENSLIDPEKILLPPLHIKLGLIKQFTKALDKAGNCFKYLNQKFPALSDAKIKEGIFIGPQIRQLIADTNFEECMNNTESEAWNGFKEVVHNFLGNKKDARYTEYVDNMLEKFEALGCNMSLKLHFLHSHLDRFPGNLGAVSEEQGERFHQDIREMERRYQGHWNTSMLADYAWCLKRDEPSALHNRKSGTRTFLSKRKRFH